MKKRTAFIGAIISLIPLGQSLFFKTGFVLSSSVVIFSLPDKVYADSANFYFNRAYDKNEKGDYYGAISAYNKSIQINSSNADAYNNRGNAKAGLEDYYGAISDYNKAIEIDPKDELAFANRGVAKKRIGDMKVACIDWQKASSLGDESAAKWLRNQC